MWTSTDHEKLRHTSESKYAFEHDQKESNAAANAKGCVPYLTGAKFLDCVHFWTDFEKTQCHPRHNESVWHHVYHEVNAHSLCKAVTNNSGLISIDLTGNGRSVRTDSFHEIRVIIVRAFLHIRRISSIFFSLGGVVLEN